MLIKILLCIAIAILLWENNLWYLVLAAAVLAALGKLDS